MNIVNVHSIDDIIDAKVMIESLDHVHVKFDDFIDKYISLNECAFVYWKDNDQAVVPYSICKVNNEKFLFIAPDDENEQQRIVDKISHTDMDNIKQLSDNELIEKMSDENIPTFEAFIINNEYYQ